jgi:uncharacterized membrane protein YozB (DUF420 family)
VNAFRPFRLLLPAVLVVALLGVVAIAATGSTPSGSARNRSPSHVFVDTFFTLTLVLMAAAALLLVYGLTQRRAIAEQRALRGRRNSLLTFLLFVLVFTTLVYIRLRTYGFAFNRGGDAGQGGRTQTFPGDDNVQDYHANFAWLPLIVIAALVLAAYLAWRLSRKRRALAEHEDETVAESLAQAIDDTLDDLRRERDPRRAIIAAYARMERALAAFGIPRRPHETQQEYLGRILGGLEVDTAAIRRLTDLFTQAKFSHHEVGPAMKEEAIDALEHTRDELRAADERRQRELDERQLQAAGA